jgi:hypothetical protein
MTMTDVTPAATYVYYEPAPAPVRYSAVRGGPRTGAVVLAFVLALAGGFLLAFLAAMAV